jgi:hypothetical protein
MKKNYKGFFMRILPPNTIDTWFVSNSYYDTYSTRE